MRDFQLVRPTSQADAIAQAAANGAFIAGGTDLMQLMMDGVEEPPKLVDLDRVVADTISASPDGLRIDTHARMSDAAEHAIVARDYPVVAQALLLSASPQVRNMATLGGNLLQRTRCGYFRDTGFPCNKRIPGSGCPAIAGDNRMLAVLGTSDHCIATNASDFAVSLVALDASLELVGPGGERTVKLTEFYREPGDTPHIETVLQPGELIRTIVVPASPLNRASHYLKVRDRATFEWAVVSAAVAMRVEGGRVAEARVAVGGVGTKPWRSVAAEAALVGREPNEAAFAAAGDAAMQGAKPYSDNAFKITLASRTVARALSALV